MVRVKIWHTHTTVWLLRNYSQRILTYYTRILLLDLTYGRIMISTVLATALCPSVCLSQASIV